jgi:uncharacterized membrane protein YgcG
MFELLLKATEGIEANEVELDDIEVTVVPVAADEVANDDRYSAEMRPQPVDLILDATRERGRVKKRPFVPRRVLPAMPRPRERRSVSRGRDDGGSGSGDDDGGGGSSDPPPPPRSSSFAGGAS